MFNEESYIKKKAFFVLFIKSEAFLLVKLNQQRPINVMENKMIRCDIQSQCNALQSESTHIELKISYILHDYK